LLNPEQMLGYGKRRIRMRKLANRIALIIAFPLIPIIWAIDHVGRLQLYTWKDWFNSWVFSWKLNGQKEKV
jgi:hypothetical protein